MMRQEKLGEDTPEPDSAKDVILEIPEAEMPEELPLPTYANSVSIVASQLDVVLTFFHVNTLQRRPGGGAEIRNEVVQRVVLPRETARNLGRILLERLPDLDARG